MKQVNKIKTQMTKMTKKEIKLIEFTHQIQPRQRNVLGRGMPLDLVNNNVIYV